MKKRFIVPLAVCLFLIELMIFSHAPEQSVRRSSRCLRVPLGRCTWICVGLPEALKTTVMTSRWRFSL